MILSDNDIKEERLNGNVIIEPFNESLINSASYDVCLGEHFWRINNKHIENIIIPFNELSIRDTFNYYKAENFQTLIKSFPYIEYTVSNLYKYKGILLKPYECVLANTEEFIGANNNLATSMKAKSSYGRLFVDAMKGAGWSEPGYINRWCMEITNFTNKHVLLISGMPVAQIIFMGMKNDAEHKYGLKKGDKYQKGNNIEEIMASWKPEDLLPKLYKVRL